MNDRIHARRWASGVRLAAAGLPSVLLLLRSDDCDLTVTVAVGHHFGPVGCVSFFVFVFSLSISTDHHEAIFHLQWQHVDAVVPLPVRMLEELFAFCAAGHRT